MNPPPFPGQVQGGGNPATPAPTTRTSGLISISPRTGSTDDPDPPDRRPDQRPGLSRGLPPGPRSPRRTVPGGWPSAAEKGFRPAFSRTFRKVASCSRGEQPATTTFSRRHSRIRSAEKGLPLGRAEQGLGMHFGHFRQRPGKGGQIRPPIFFPRCSARSHK